MSESVYVLSPEISGETITTSLQSLLPTRRHAIARHRFTVLDTFDGRVRRAGACLTRNGVNGGATVAWQPQGGGSVTMRLNEPPSFAWDLPDGPLQQVLAPVIGPRRLLAQADAEEYGSLLEILDENGKTVARLRVASGQARLPVTSAAWRPLPTMVTLTALRGYEEIYKQLVPVLESRPGLRRCPEGPVGVILGQLGARLGDDVSSPRVDLAPTVRADIGARRIHRALVALLDANEPGLRANLDTEFLHDFRVTVRRTRSLLGQIRRVFPADVVERFAAEFSWIGRLTGPPRDMDVLLLSLRECRAEYPAEDMEALLAFLAGAQRHEHDRLVEALDSDRYRQLVADWKAFLERPVASRPEAPNAGQRLTAVVARRAWKLSRRISATAASIDDHTPADQLHKIRIDAKKLRYLIDVTPSFYEAGDLACVLGALKKLQRALGDFNDADVQERRLLECGHALGAAGGPAGALLILGRLAEQRRQRSGHLRGLVAEKLARFRARDTRAACRRAFKKP